MWLLDQWRWARNEWGILAKREEMSVQDAGRWLAQWVPFGMRTVFFGSLSLTFGPLTKDHAASTWAMKAWSRRSLRALRLPVDVRGAHLVPAGGVMYASNHQSLLDILVLGAVLPGDLKWATKRSIMKVPFLGWHLALSGHVPVDRKAGKQAAAEAINRFEQVLVEDKALLIFPEGTRSSDGEVQPFKNGGFYAAVRAGKPVVPVALDGTHTLMAKHESDSGDPRDAAERLAHVRIGEPIAPPTVGAEKERVEWLRDRAREEVVAMQREIRAMRPARRADGR